MDADGGALTFELAKECEGTNTTINTVDTKRTTKRSLITFKEPQASAPAPMVIIDSEFEIHIHEFEIHMVIAT